MKRSALALAVSMIALAPAACSHDEQPSPRESTGEHPVVTQNLDAPWSVAFADDTPLVSERDSARILELDATGEPREVAVIDDVEPSGEGGLLGIAVHDIFLYAYFTAGDENRVDRFPLSGAPGALRLGDPETILGGIPAASNHNGGRIAFGPDEMLYVTTGDAGTPDDAQDRSSLAGKILRLSPEGAVPDDNPFPDSPVHSLGHRNPQGIAWADGGTMYAAEFGQDTWDELNVIEPGRNYGWPEVEGIANRTGFVDPVQQWEPSDASPSGIAVIGEEILIANLRGESLRRVPQSALDTSSETLTDLGRLRDVTVTPSGQVWVVTNNTDGRGEASPGDDRIVRALHR